MPQVLEQSLFLFIPGELPCRLGLCRSFEDSSIPRGTCINNWKFSTHFCKTLDTWSRPWRRCSLAARRGRRPGTGLELPGFGGRNRTKRTEKIFLRMGVQLQCNSGEFYACLELKVLVAREDRRSNHRQLWTRSISRFHYIQKAFMPLPIKVRIVELTLQSYVGITPIHPGFGPTPVQSNVNTPKVNKQHTSNRVANTRRPTIIHGFPWDDWKRRSVPKKSGGSISRILIADRKRDCGNKKKAQGQRI